MLQLAHSIPVQWRIAATVIAIQWGFLRDLIAENLFDSRFQYYTEDDGRVDILSSDSLFSYDLNDSLTLDGTLLYSAISGASPTGLPPEKRGGNVPLATLDDERIAFTLSATKKIAHHALKAGFSYSNESDYLSLGGSIQDTIELNEKNTEAVLGFAYTYDRVGAGGTDLDEAKRSYDWMVGVNQVLGPNTLLSANLTLAYKSGFLSDPYKYSLIDDEAWPEERPHKRFDQLVNLQLTHYLEPLGASVELGYRFGHSDYGTISHTASIALSKTIWNDRLLLRPSFRFYDQSAADFYAVDFSGDPQHFSSDYRLSGLQTFTFGLQVEWRVIPDRMNIHLGYERYLMRGTDGQTAPSAYPDAHAVTAGFSVRF